MSKTRLLEAVKNLDLAETKKILDGKPELLTIWNDQAATCCTWHAAWTARS